MANQVVRWRCFKLFFIIIFGFDISGVDSATITIINNCPNTVWPVILTAGPGQPQLSTTGFQLPSGTSRRVEVAAPWTGRVWARTRCSTTNGRFVCLTGDCGSGEVSCRGAGGVPPATQAEFTLAPNGGQDFYDISLVDGFNLPASITAQGGGGRCRSPKCLADVNAVCPAELQVKMFDGEVIGCKSACSTFNQPQYCCTGEFNDANKCKPTAYSRFFKAQCPEAYSYPYDDGSSSFTCNGQPNYVVSFCGEDDRFSVCRGPILLDISKVKTLI